MPTRRRYNKRRQIKIRQRSKKLRGGTKKGRAAITSTKKKYQGCFGSGCLGKRTKRTP